MKIKLINRLFVLAAVIAAVVVLSGFTSKTLSEEQLFINNLLEERTVIMQQAMFSVHNSPDGVADIENIYDAFHQLADIETYPILSEDCSAISLSASTDFDKVVNLMVTDAYITSQTADAVFYRVNIVWYMCGNDGHYENQCSYRIMTRLDKDVVKLANMELIG